MSLASVQTRMPVVAVAGTAADRGHQHGELLRDAIAECVAIYDGVFKLSDDEVARRSAHFEAVTRAWHPELAAEIDAIAESSGMEHP